MNEVSKLVLKTGNNHAHEISDNNTEIINEIIMTLAIILNNYIENHGKHSAEDLAQGYSTLGSRNNKLAFTSLISSLYSVDYSEGLYPEQVNKHIARHLLKQNINYMNLPDLSKLLKKLEPYGIFYKIEGKKNIKLKSPEGLPRKPKAGIKRREGYYVIRKTTRSIEDFKRIIGDPNTLAVINQRLSGYHDLLRIFYELLVDDIIEAIKKGNEQINAFLTACLTSTFPNLDRNKVDWESFKKKLENRARKNLEEDKKAFVSYLLQNPNSHFFILSLTRLP